MKLQISEEEYVAMMQAFAKRTGHKIGTQLENRIGFYTCKQCGCALRIYCYRRRSSLYNVVTKQWEYEVEPVYKYWCDGVVFDDMSDVIYCSFVGSLL